MWYYNITQSCETAIKTALSRPEMLYYNITQSYKTAMSDYVVKSIYAILQYHAVG